MFFLFRKSIMAKYFHHWLFTLLIVVFCQIYINEIVFLSIDIRNTFLAETDQLNLPNTTPIFNDFETRYIRFTNYYSPLMALVCFTLFTDLSLLSMSRKPCKVTFGHGLMLTSFVILIYSISGTQIYLRDYQDKTFLAMAFKI